MASTADSQWTNSALANEFVNCYNYDCYCARWSSHISAGAWAAYDQHNSAMTAGAHEVAYRQEDNKRVLISEKNWAIGHLGKFFPLKETLKEFNSIDEMASNNLSGWQKGKLY